MGLTTNRTVWQYMTCVFLLLTAVFSVLFYLQNIFVSIIFGLILIVLISQAAALFNSLTAGCSRGMKVIIASALCAAVLISVLLAAAVQMGSITEAAFYVVSFGSDYEAISDQAAVAAHRLLTNGQSDGPNILLDVVKQIIQSGSGLLTSVQSALSDISSIVFTAALSLPLMLILYFTKRDAFVLKVNEWVPPRYRPSFWEMVSSILFNMKRFLSLKVLEAVILAFIFAIGFYLSGLPYAILIGLLMGVFSIVPYVGLVIIAVPIALLAYSLGPGVLIGVLITITIAQIVDLFVILPNLLSEDIKVSPLVAIVLTLAAWQILGVLGLVLAMPVYMVYKIVLTACYNQLVRLFPESEPAAGDSRDGAGSRTA